jgi:two-component system cell cycle sensor histidine kinase/response regulator CckA
VPLPPLERALASLPMSAELVARDGRLAYVNASFERLTGYPASEALGSDVEALLGAGGALGPSWRRAFEGALAGEATRCALECRARDGSFVAHEVELSPVRGEGDVVEHALVLRRALADPREAEGHYRAIFDQNPAVKLLIDPSTGRIVDANAAAERFYGWSRATLRTKRMAEINTLSEAEIQAAMRDASSGARGSFRFRHRLADASEREVEVFSGPIRMGDETLLLSILHDVTERERAKAALVWSEARFRELLHNLPVGVSVHRKGLFTYVNEAFCALVGRRASELVGGDVFAVLPADVRDDLRARTGALRRDELPTGLVRQAFERPDGSRVDVDLRILPSVLEGLPVIITLSIDASERDRLEQQLQRAQRMDALGRLAGGIAHDFNNLLFVVLSSATMLERRLTPGSPGSSPPPASAVLLGDLRRIEDAARRAAELTKQLLLFSRGQSEASDAQALDASVVIEGLENLLRGSLGESLELSLALEPGCHVALPKHALEQLVVNLAVNARDAMGEGGALTIRAARVSRPPSGPLPPGPFVLLTVSDTGTGMTEEVAAHAFEPFFTTKEPGRGTGLGLAITYGIVRRAGGHIELDTAPGRGSTFRIWLPAKQSPHEAPVSAVAPSSRGMGETILLVEDNEHVRDVVLRILTDAGYRVLACGGPGEALLVAERHVGPLQLLVTDVVMPRMSGPDLAARLTKGRPELPVLFISGYPGEALEGVALGADAELLPKPFSFEELLRAVERLLSRRRPARVERAGEGA